MRNPFMALVHVGEGIAEAGKLTTELRHVRSLIRDVKSGDWPKAAADAAPFIDAAVQRLGEHHSNILDALNELSHAVAHVDEADNPRADAKGYNPPPVEKVERPAPSPRPKR